VIAAVTGHDEDNLIVAQIAKRRFNVPRTVARINNPRNEFIFAELGIDATVSATQVILSIILQEIPSHPFVHLLSLREGGIEFVEMQLASGSPAIGRSLSDIALPDDTAIPLLLRGPRAMVVQSDTVFEEGDKLIAVTTTSQEVDLKAHLLGAESQVAL
jgi:trk system potassium uptake protein TrkA